MINQIDYEEIFQGLFHEFWNPETSDNIFVDSQTIKKELKFKKERL